MKPYHVIVKMKTKKDELWSDIGVDVLAETQEQACAKAEDKCLDESPSGMYWIESYVDG